jgi:hypothetical protein
MKRDSVPVQALLTLLLALWCRPAAADPIQITGGNLQMTPTFGTLALLGDRGFTLSGFVSTSSGGPFQPWERCHVSPVCRPGTVIDMGGYWVGLGLRGATATLDGRTFLDVGGLISPNQAAVRFAGSVVAPDFDGGTATVVAPFHFEGAFSYADGAELLFGQGLATLSLRKSFGDDQGPFAWDFASARYDFTPTPEPGAILLTAAGLAGLAARGWRRGR